MNSNRMLLSLSLLIVCCALPLEGAIARIAQESDRDRNRDAWQRPTEVFDALAIKPGHRTADIGCGYGYFSFRLAARVGAEGKVYAVDIDPKAIDRVRQRKEREKLEQVEPILGESDDPRLPGDLDSVLIVDTYHEFRNWDRMMQAVFRALRPGARLVIIDGEGPSGRPRTEYHRLHTIPDQVVREEVTRNWFVFKESRPGFYDAEYGKKMYFLVFEKPQSKSPPESGSRGVAVGCSDGFQIPPTKLVDRSYSAYKYAAPFLGESHQRSWWIVHTLPTRYSSYQGPANAFPEFHQRSSRY